MRRALTNPEFRSSISRNRICGPQTSSAWDVLPPSKIAMARANILRWSSARENLSLSGRLDLEIS